MARAMATSYRAKLTRSRADALSAKAQFEALVAKNPRDPEAQVALGAWHLEAVGSLGGLVARAALGARKDTGLDATDRAVALGGDRALFRGIAALLRLSLDPRDPLGASLAECGFARRDADAARPDHAASRGPDVRGGEGRQFAPHPGARETPVAARAVQELTAAARRGRDRKVGRALQACIRAHTRINAPPSVGA